MVRQTSPKSARKSTTTATSSSAKRIASTRTSTGASSKIGGGQSLGSSQVASDIYDEEDASYTEAAAMNTAFAMLNAGQYPFKNEEYVQEKGEVKRKKWKNAKQITDLTSTLDGFTYCNIASPPSLRPRKKYCDITGLPTRYVDPKTGLRYHSVPVYQYIKGLSTQTVQEILQLRNAGVIFK